MQDEKDSTQAVLADNPAEHRYEARVGGRVAAVAQYSLSGDTITFTHTEVQPGFEGKGMGSQIARLALDDVRRRGLRAVPACEFIAGYIAKHAEYQDLLRSKG